MQVTRRVGDCDCDEDSENGSRFAGSSPHPGSNSAHPGGTAARRGGTPGQRATGSGDVGLATARCTSTFAVHGPETL
jgi:hypothetical protein